MQIGLFITARLGSQRLTEKHLRLVKNRPILCYLIDRLQEEFSTELKNKEAKIIITTSKEENNRRFEDFSSPFLSVFYGSIDNIPLRHLEAMQALGMQAAVSIDGDDILCSRKAMRAVYDNLKKKTPMVKTTGWPLGMNASGYSKDFLEESLKNHSNEKLETGWGRIFDETKIDTVSFPDQTVNTSLRLTLDYEKDLEFFTRVIEDVSFPSCTDEEIVKSSEKFESINSSLSEEYWQNFNRAKAQESKPSNP